VRFRRPVALYRLHLGFPYVIECADDVEAPGTGTATLAPAVHRGIDYSYSFTGSSTSGSGLRYATQRISATRHVADKHDLRRDIQFSTRIVAATWNDEASLWRLSTDRGDEISCRFYIMATGCLSQPKTPDMEGVDRFAGETFYTSRWPHSSVDFSGKRVAVIGTLIGVQSVRSSPGGRPHRVQRTANSRGPPSTAPCPR
jgi:hypothetical protein